MVWHGRGFSLNRHDIALCELVVFGIGAINLRLYKHVLQHITEITGNSSDFHAFLGVIQQ